MGEESINQEQLIKLNIFLEKAKEKHGDLYDYSKVIINNNIRPIIIGCKIHGDFSQSPINHLHTNGCNKCGIIARTGITKTIVRKNLKLFPKTTEDFIIKAIETHGTRMKQLYQECINRKNIFEENGYAVIYMWECDWKTQNV